MGIELKKTKDSANRKKITISLSEDAIKLYRQGKDNGWDTPDLAVRAVEEALKAKQEDLNKKAG